ncbi:MAG TPA: selenocysteine-specific translation elongation factor [Spirochaetota bacterium]|nr:selenocysteine-specific translation elongation factor [Spirochaetota bacterium]HPI87826.1 selenocysteine-specific translation elongation factor [Spirochaetota bacterium]
MYIVGTSGHIDHGKTSLIQALTGINCDRLPEEKQREMTIDIGFASIDYPRFGTVSIIDVPGHERFIRNMVVGAWGIDLGLLVVAADDGWMPQTEDHFRVLQLLGIERIIAVINKTDLADAEMVDIVEDEIRQKLQETRYADADIIRVSSKTGEGIERLRETIVENLRKLKKISDSSKPYLYVDRAFAAKGHGTVVTGTLKNGIFKEDDTVTVLPKKSKARIKKIESHYHELQEGNPSQRTALNLPGITLDEIFRGSVIVKENFFTESRDIIAQMRLLDPGKEIKNNLGVEILIGTASLKGKLILMDEGTRETTETFAARIRFDDAWFFYPGEPFILTSPGGFRILGGGTVLFPGYNAKKHKKTVKDIISHSDIKNVKDIVEFILNVTGWSFRKEIISLFPMSEKKMEKTVQELIDSGSLTVLDDLLLTTDNFSKARKAILAAIEDKVGPNLKEISDTTGLPLELCKAALASIMKTDFIIEKDGCYFSGKSITEENLPAKKQTILRDVLEKGGEGIELDKIKDDPLKREIGELIKLDFLVSLDGIIIYHRKKYEEFTEKIMALFEDRDKISISDARDASGLSRKYIIPLLNRIERDGKIKRLGDFRIKT